MTLAQLRLFLSAIDRLNALDSAQNLQINALAMGGNPKAIRDNVKALTG